uniref:Uncharacterized protein n=1 Tax=Magnetococcus massalia (strain MO-1) TaxID=451514 RepID=A0A1S7LQ07_MAGMO|nr:Protein of unknown function [Candidatus Magnetococcus massalia]
MGRLERLWLDTKDGVILYPGVVPTLVTGYVCWDWRKDASPTSIAARGRKANAFRASRGVPEKTPSLHPSSQKTNTLSAPHRFVGFGDAYGYRLRTTDYGLRTTDYGYGLLMKTLGSAQTRWEGDDPLPRPIRICSPSKPHHLRSHV